MRALRLRQPTAAKHGKSWRPHRRLRHLDRGRDRNCHSAPHGEHLSLHPEQPGRHRREAVGGKGLDQDRASSRSTARRASSRKSCAAASISSFPSATASTNPTWSRSGRARSPMCSRATARRSRRPRCSRPTITEDKSNFQDVAPFLMSGGQKGPQRKILREGTYAINTTQFAIITDERVLRPRLERAGAATCSTACSRRSSIAAASRRRDRRRRRPRRHRHRA